MNTKECSPQQNQLPAYGNGQQYGLTHFIRGKSVTHAHVQPEGLGFRFLTYHPNYPHTFS